MKENKPDDTEKIILAAAKIVFMRAGYSGARMQEIADEAGINKSLLHYYFRSKEKLFDVIFSNEFNKLIPQLFSVFNSEMPLFDKIRYFFEHHIQFLIENSYLPAFLLQEINRNPQRYIDRFPKAEMIKDVKFFQQLKEEIAAGNIRPINPIELFINILSLSIFQFAATPLLKGIFNFDDTKFLEFVTSRKNTLAEFVINSLIIHK